MDRRARLDELLVFLRGGPGEQLWLRKADREAVGLAPREVELALAGCQRLEVEPLDAGPDLGRRVALGEHVAVATRQRARGSAAGAGQRAHAVVVHVAVVYRDDGVVDVVRRRDVHPELVGGYLLLQGAPGELLGGAHAVIDEPHLVQRLQDRRGLRRDLAAHGVDLGGEVPAADGTRTVVAVAVDTVAESGDRLGVLLHVGPGGRGRVGVEPGPGEQRPVDDQALRVVGRRQSVERLARGFRGHRRRDDVGERRHRLGVHVGGDVGGLARVEDLVEVGEVGVVEVGLGAGLERGGELGRDLTLAGVGDALDGDVGVRLLEGGDVLDPLLVLSRRGGRRLAVDADGHVAIARGAGGAAA